jgi:hypothetical protein
MPIYIRSENFLGYNSSTQGTGSGWMLYNGPVMQEGTDGYDGAGMDMISSNSAFRFSDLNDGIQIYSNPASSPMLDTTTQTINGSNILKPVGTINETLYLSGMSSASTTGYISCTSMPNDYYLVISVAVTAKTPPTSYNFTGSVYLQALDYSNLPNYSTSSFQVTSSYKFAPETFRYIAGAGLKGDSIVFSVPLAGSTYNFANCSFRYNVQLSINTGILTGSLITGYLGTSLANINGVLSKL